MIKKLNEYKDKPVYIKFCGTEKEQYHTIAEINEDGWFKIFAHKNRIYFINSIEYIREPAQVHRDFSKFPL